MMPNAKVRPKTSVSTNRLANAGITISRAKIASVGRSMGSVRARRAEPAVPRDWQRRSLSRPHDALRPEGEHDDHDEEGQND